MLSASAYKIVHLFGIFLIMLSLGGALTHLINGGGREHGWRKQIGISHGVGLLLVLLGGFGMIAKLNYAYTEGWIIVKIIIWLLFGGMLTYASRTPSAGRLLWWASALLGILAAYMAIWKPF